MSSKGYHHTKEAKNKISLSKLGKSRPDITGENNINWKEDLYSVDAVHKWLKHIKGSASKCSLNKLHVSTKYEWCNLDHKYRRNINDYIELCHHCHVLYDHGKIKIKNKYITDRGIVLCKIFGKPKLSEHQVTKIRNSRLSANSLAKRYSVTYHTIRNIITGRTRVTI